MTAYFPQQYMTSFLEHLAARDDINFLRYCDLPFGNDWDYKKAYPSEHSNWWNHVDDSKIHLLIQYDLDRDVQATMEQLATHRHLGVPANLMVFGMTDMSAEYVLNWDLLRKLHSDKLLCLGLHNNCYELADFDKVLASRLFALSREFLEVHLGVAPLFYSAHGGRRDAAGKSNASWDCGEQGIELGMRWVHNRYTVRFSHQYSDGGINSARYSNSRDLVKFVQGMEKGGRYRILLHPQNYKAEWKPADVLADQEWYERACKRPKGVWAGITA